MSFADSMEAKDFLASRIVEEARRRHVGLSELERKMLYFSETSPTLPDMMEVAGNFETECDDAKYEAKIKRLSRRAFQRDQKESPEKVQLWREAIRILKKEDHYILVMLDVPRSARDVAKLAVAGLLVAALVMSVIAASHWAGQHIHLRIPETIQYLALVVVFVLAYYLAFSKKASKLGNSFGGLVERVVRWF